MENSRECNEKPIPSFFQNSCPGNSAVEGGNDEDLVTKRDSGNGKLTSPPDKRQKVIGGITCCVPECFRNSLRNPELSFYVIPNGVSKSKQDLRKKWLHMISRKDFCPGPGHRVCSEHFVGGKKTYTNNVPVIVPKNKNKKENKERKTVKSRTRTFELKSTGEIGEQNEEVTVEAYDNNFEEQEGKENVGTIRTTEDSLEERIARLELENNKLKEKNEQLIQEKITLEAIVHRNFSVDTVKEDEKLFKFYTGLPDYETFKIIFESFGAAVNNLVYSGSHTNEKKINSPSYIKKGPKRTLNPEKEFFLVLVRLRLGLLEYDIAYRAGISSSQFSRIWITWLDFLHSKFRTFPIWPSTAGVQKTMPSCFRETYPSTRAIIDCTEIYIEKASSVRSQSSTYSNYKHHNTAKGLIGITPAGAVSFVSDLYTGRTSDKKATQDSQIFTLLETGDSVMADKGFDIGEDLPQGVHLNIPPFLRGKDHLSIQEEAQTRQIAAVRIHVERAISRIKTFRILSTVFPISMAANLNKIWVVCSYLTNFLPPLINENN